MSQTTEGTDEREEWPGVVTTVDEINIGHTNESTADYSGTTKTFAGFYGEVDIDEDAEEEDEGEAVFAATHECSICGEKRDLGDHDRQYADCPNCGKRRFFDPIEHEGDDE